MLFCDLSWNNRVLEKFDSLNFNFFFEKSRRENRLTSAKAITFLSVEQAHFQQEHFDCVDFVNILAPPFKKKKQITAALL
jgi:hypothetical protein